ncbi:MAG: hypothetical protein HY727_08880 [Candidatus Rokubacteria bacterium]|nr:hypothetical protein [Candidatus Rokubacteria bacterium]
MNVLSPLGLAPREVRPLARRRSSLRGLTIGILDNSKPNADALLGRTAEILAERAGAGAVRWWRKPGSSRPASVIDEVARASDVVLTGSAD